MYLKAQKSVLHQILGQRSFWAARNRVLIEGALFEIGLKKSTNRGILLEIGSKKSTNRGFSKFLYEH